MLTDHYLYYIKSFNLIGCLSNLNIGTRLRYEFKREFAPYIGIEWNKNYGNTNNYSSLDETYFVLGVKFWF